MKDPERGGREHGKVTIKKKKNSENFYYQLNILFLTSTGPNKPQARLKKRKKQKNRIT